MIRIIVQTDNAGMAVHVGGDVDTTFTTFDVTLPELEVFLRETVDYTQRRVIGVEILPD